MKIIPINLPFVMKIIFSYKTAFLYEFSYFFCSGSSIIVGINSKLFYDIEVINTSSEYKSHVCFFFILFNFSLV